jgi:hypothetical protein
MATRQSGPGSSSVDFEKEMVKTWVGFYLIYLLVAGIPSVILLVRRFGWSWRFFAISVCLMDRRRLVHRDLYGDSEETSWNAGV